MLARHVVLLPQAANVCLPSATSPESTLAEVFILNSLNPFRLNTCHGEPRFAQFLCNVSPFRINTCKSVSKQMTLTPFRINTYEKTGGWGALLGFERSNLFPAVEFILLFNRFRNTCKSAQRNQEFGEGGTNDKKKSSSFERRDSRAGSRSRLPRSGASDRSQRAQSHHSRVGRSHKGRASP